MMRLARRGGVAALLFAFACGNDAEPGPPPGLAPAAPAIFSVYGLPGPWSREGASRDDFDVESRSCRDRSSEARRTAPAGEGSQTAYRVFLDCMQERRWFRGLPPSRLAPS